jgi:hypothetical protein
MLVGHLGGRNGPLRGLCLNRTWQEQRKMRTYIHALSEFTNMNVTVSHWAIQAREIIMSYTFRIKCLFLPLLPLLLLLFLLWRITFSRLFPFRINSEIVNILHSVDWAPWTAINRSEVQYVTRTQKFPERHPCLGWDSNPRSKCLSGRKYFVLYTSRSLRSASVLMAQKRPQTCNECSRYIPASGEIKPVNYHNQTGSLLMGVQNGSGAHATSYPMGNGGSILGVKLPGREDYQSPPSSAEVNSFGAVNPFLLTFPWSGA